MRDSSSIDPAFAVEASEEEYIYVWQIVLQGYIWQVDLCCCCLVIFLSLGIDPSARAAIPPLTYCVLLVDYIYLPVSTSPLLPPFCLRIMFLFFSTFSVLTFVLRLAWLVCGALFRMQLVCGALDFLSALIDSHD